MVTAAVRVETYERSVRHLQASGGKKFYDAVVSMAKITAVMVLSTAYPLQLAVVRTPAGAWEVAYQ